LPAYSATPDAEPSACSALISAFPAPGRADPPALHLVTDTVTGLLERFASIPEHRQSAWVDHPLPAVLALCAGAVVAGMGSFTAIAGWITDASEEILTCAYAGSGRPVPATGPSRITVWRVLTGLDAAALDTAIGDWLLDQAHAEIEASRSDPAPPEAEYTTSPGQGKAAESVGRLSGVAIAADGKTCRGAKTVDGKQIHLLSVMTHDTRLVLNQIEVGAKTNEVPRLRDLIKGMDLDLRGAVLTVDALHTVRATAKALHRKGIDFVMTVKENTPKLFAALDALPWEQTPIGHTSTERAHGRITRRTVQTLPAPEDLPFPHVGQAFLIERSVTDLKGKNLSSVAALGVLSLDPAHADPARAGGLVRGHWAIESMHWIRDTLYREDHSKVRTRSGPRAMAALRNLATGAHRLAGRTDITEATRWASRYMDRPFRVLNLDQRS
jgi:predicted transposase YbfD/YdcC